MSEAAVVAKGLSKSFGRRWALIDVGFEASWGSVVGIAGRNGSGKSTLLRLLATQLRPDAGEAIVAGHSLREARDAVRTQTALLGHESCLYPGLTAIENLRVTARFLGTDTSRATLQRALETYELGERADDVVAGFSAGMTKRLSLARHRLKPARVVLLDEPFSALDPRGFRLVESIVAEVRDAGGCVLMATHLLGRAERLCDRAILLDAGRIAWSGPATELSQAAGERGGPE